jgi:mRNA interferase HigB
MACFGALQEGLEGHVVDGPFPIMGTWDVKVYGEAAVTQFAGKYAASRKPLQRFLEIARASAWPHFPAVKQTFASADYAPATGTLIFDIGGNQYRLVASVDFEEEVLYIDAR